MPFDFNTNKKNNSSLGGFGSGPTKKSPFNPPRKEYKNTMKRSGYSLSSLSFADIPWKYILLALIIVVAVILCVIYRQAITSFLMELLTWAIIIFAIVLIIRFGIFRRRGRRW